MHEPRQTEAELFIDEQERALFIISTKLYNSMLNSNHRAQILTKNFKTFFILNLLDFNEILIK